MAADDPFHHLHDEDYARPYLSGLVGAETYVPVNGRPVLSLAGDWRLTLDLFDEGLRQRWFALDETPPSQWPQPRDYEIEAGELVPVPSCWNLLKPEWTSFEGAAWYTRHLDWLRGPAGSGRSSTSARPTMRLSSSSTAVMSAAIAAARRRSVSM